MTIIGFLQNMWFKDPEKARAIFERNPEHRNKLIGTYLFMGCLTGRRLEQVFGEKLCDQIIWEECSLEIGGKSASSFPANGYHMYQSILKHKPQIILAFGTIAEGAVRDICWANEDVKAMKVLYGPHPASRKNTLYGLQEMKRELDELIRLQP